MKYNLIKTMKLEKQLVVFNLPHDGSEFNITYNKDGHAIQWSFDVYASMADNPESTVCVGVYDSNFENTVKILKDIQADIQTENLTGILKTIKSEFLSIITNNISENIIQDRKNNLGVWDYQNFSNNKKEELSQTELNEEIEGD